MKKITKILSLVILITFVISIFSNVKAVGSFSVSAVTSMKKGQTSTLTITTNNATGKFKVSSSNSSVVSVSTSSVFVDGSEKVTLTAGGVGTATITVTPNRSICKWWFTTNNST